MRIFFSFLMLVALNFSSAAFAQDFPMQIKNGKSYFEDSLPLATIADADTIKKTHSVELKYVDECEREVTPQISNIDIGSRFPNSKIILIPDSLCYGNAGSLIVILDASGRTLLRTNGGGVVVLDSSKDGVRNIGLDEPGFSAPIWQWNDAAHSYQHLMNVPLVDK